jgi:hypothetical protein
MFEQVELEWKGRKYIIPPRRVMGALAKVEDHLTMIDLEQAASRQTLPFAKIANAYAALLQWAGCPVGADEVYEGLLSGGDDQATVMLTCVQHLQELFLPRQMREKIAANSGNSKAVQADTSPVSTASNKGSSKASISRSSRTRRARG